MAKQRRKTSKIWSIPKNELEQALEETGSLSGTLKKFGVFHYGNNQKTLKSVLEMHGIDYSAVIKSKGRSKIIHSQVPLEEVLVVKSSYSRSSLKKRLFKNGLLKEECYICGIGPVWNNRKLSLQIDHINGVPDDNRLENLRILCPNCHSQTDTFTSRKLKRATPRVRIRQKISNRKSNRKPKPTKCPSAAELQKLLWEMPATKIGKIFGVSDKAVEKWAIKLGLEKPGRGYWRKIYTGKQK